MAIDFTFNTLRPRQHDRHFADDIFKCIFVNENIWIPIIISLKFVSNGSINNIPALVQIMAWRRPGDKPLSEPLNVNLSTHICVTRPQWGKGIKMNLSWVTWYKCHEYHIESILLELVHAFCKIHDAQKLYLACNHTRSSERCYKHFANPQMTGISRQLFIYQKNPQIF